MAGAGVEPNRSSWDTACIAHPIGQVAAGQLDDAGKICAQQIEHLGVNPYDKGNHAGADEQLLNRDLDAHAPLKPR